MPTPNLTELEKASSLELSELDAMIERQVIDEGVIGSVALTYRQWTLVMEAVAAAAANAFIEGR